MVARGIPNYRLYRAKSDESDDFWLHSETLPLRSRLHNWEISLHRHDALFQIFMLETGEGELLSRTERTVFAAPCAIYIAPGAVHGFRYSHDADGLVLTVLGERLSSVRDCDPGIAAYLSQSRVTPLGNEDHEDRGLAAIAARLHEEIHGPGAGSEVLLDAMVTEIVLRLARAGAEALQDLENPARPHHDRHRMNALTALVAAHCREHRPVGFYAAKLGLSPAHLNRIARREAGTSVRELAAQHLLRAARRDLIFTPTPVQTIAYSLGFQDPAYFNRFFKRETGMTPGAFREVERQKMAA